MSDFIELISLMNNKYEEVVGLMESKNKEILCMFEKLAKRVDKLENNDVDEKVYLLDFFNDKEKYQYFRFDGDVDELKSKVSKDLFKIFNDKVFGCGISMKIVNSDEYYEKFGGEFLYTFYNVEYIIKYEYVNGFYDLVYCEFKVNHCIDL